MKKSNHSVDISQQTAPSFREDDKEAAINEAAIETLKKANPWGFRYPGGPVVGEYQHVWGDPESEEKLRQLLGGKSTAERAEEQRTEEEQPFDQDSFMSDTKAMQSEYDKRHKKI